MKFETHTIKDFTDFKKLQHYVKINNFDTCVLDVEADGVLEVKAKLYGVGLCFQDEEAFYIPWRNQSGVLVWSPEEELDIKTWLYNTCQERKLVGHNIIYDVLVLDYNLDINLTDFIYSDTILQKHALDEEPPFGLKEISVLELGDWADKAQEKLKDNVVANGGRFTKTQKDMFLANTEVLAEYCCWDVILTYKLFQKFESRLESEGLHNFFYKEETMDLYKHCTIPMRRQGFPIDVKYFETLKSEIQGEITQLNTDIYTMIAPDVEEFEEELLDKTFPLSNKGNFPKAAATILGIPLPLNKKTGKVTLAKKAVELQAIANKADYNFYQWVITGNKNLDITKHKKKIQRKMYFEKYPEQKSVFNLKSNDHLIAWLIEGQGHQPEKFTDKGKPKVDDKFLDTVASVEPAVAQLQDLKKLNKLLGTYVEGILSREYLGVIYTSLLQFGTTSGRYASKNPNLQNLPRPRESGLSPLVLKYVNSIRAGFIPPTGYVLVDADYSALEPRCFSHVSGDEKLQGVFLKGEDLYSRIAIDVFALKGVSANPTDSNYLGTVDKEYRQQAKVFTLAVPYGAEGPRISEAMKIDKKSAYEIIRKYLDAYPGLKKFMYKANAEAKQKGYVKTEFGRIRHLKSARGYHTLYGDDLLDYRWAKKRDLLLQRREFKNLLNNAKNVKIQGLAAHIMNRAMIAIAKEFKRLKLDAKVLLQVHDQIITCARKDQAELVKDVMRRCMETTTKISVPLIAEPQIATNLRDSH